MTPEQKELFIALKAIELNDKYIYDLENEIKILDFKKREALRQLDIRKDQTKGIHLNYYRCLAEISHSVLDS